MAGFDSQPTLDVVGAVIVSQDRVLCVRRGPAAKLPGMWEFPGGKVEAGEAPRAALAREIREELRCEVAVGKQVESTIHAYDFATINLTTFYCTLTDGEPVLTEHSELMWLAPTELDRLDWAPADLPAVARIRLDLA